MRRAGDRPERPLAVLRREGLEPEAGFQEAGVSCAAAVTGGFLAGGASWRSKKATSCGHNVLAACLETTAPTWPPLRLTCCLSWAPQASINAAALGPGTMLSFSKVTARWGTPGVSHRCPSCSVRPAAFALIEFADVPSIELTRQ